MQKILSAFLVLALACCGTANAGLDNYQYQINKAKTDAISAAATDATTKANNAQSAAASDATTKANNAQSAAISAAATDATTKANNVRGQAYANTYGRSTSKVFVASEAGEMHYSEGGGGITFELPSLSTMTVGKGFTFYNNSSGLLTIFVSGGVDGLIYAYARTAANLILYPGESVSLISIYNVAWMVTSKSRAIAYTPQVTPFPSAGVSITQSHSLGHANFMPSLELICLTAEFGYVAGDVVTWSGEVSDGSIISNLWHSATEVGALNKTGSSNWLIRNKTNGSTQIPTPVNWAYRFRMVR